MRRCFREEALEATLRSMITAAGRAPDAPGHITGVRELIHVPGNLAGQGETQIFLSTAGWLCSLDHGPPHAPGPAGRVGRLVFRTDCRHAQPAASQYARMVPAGMLPAQFGFRCGKPVATARRAAGRHCQTIGWYSASWGFVAAIAVDSSGAVAGCSARWPVRKGAP